MQQLSRKLFLLGSEPTFWCPGCEQMHRVNVYAPNDYTKAQWTWDNNVEQPTFSPSYNIVGVCHSFIKAGKIQFLGDCTHKLKGQTVDLPDFPQDMIDENNVTESNDGF
jgi:Family of unknown function (DUF6527)